MHESTEFAFSEAGVVIAPASRWVIRLLGKFEARSGDTVLARLPTRAVTLLLARLALQPGSAHSREELVELLWPEAEPEAGPRNLRTALSTLRRLLEPPGSIPGSVIGTDNRHIWVEATAIDCDAVRFETHAAAGRAEEARALYRGDLLTGFYDAWVLEHRRHLADIAAGLSGRPSLRSARPAAETAPPLPNPGPTGAPWQLLPTYPSAFFGREAETPALLEALARHRLVTLAGFGGCGKTRLAIQAARLALGFDIQAFVPLADCKRPEEILDNLRRALGLPPDAAQPLKSIHTLLRGRRSLLVLDNFEQLADSEGTAVVCKLLAELPRLHLLLTTRRALQVAEEAVFPLRPLPTPPDGADLAALAANPCIALFCDRARRSRPEFQLSRRNAPGLVALCRMLEGLPFQIEIAAARIRAYTPAEMCESIARDAGLMRLMGPSAQRQTRHVSAQAAIEWSWQLLSRRQQLALSALSVFRGGWTLEAAAAVMVSTEPRAWLEEFEVCSLIHPQSADGATSRFTMLEALREFLQARVTPSRRIATLRRRHRSHFANWAAALAQDQFAAVSAELANIEQAFASALQDGDFATGARLANDLGWYWTAQGASRTTLLAMLELARALADTEAVKCPLLCVLARLMIVAGEAERARLCVAEAASCSGDDGRRRAQALVAEASVDWLLAHDGAKVLPRASEALRLGQLHDLPKVTARAQYLLGAIESARRPAEARALLLQAEQGFRATRDTYGRLTAVVGQIQCLNLERRFSQAIAAARLAQVEAERLHLVSVQLLLFNALGLAYEGARNWCEAVRVCQQQTRLAARYGMTYHVAFGLWNQLRPLARAGQFERAITLLAFAQAYWQRMFGPLDAADLRNSEKVKRLARLQLTAAHVNRLWAQGLALPDDDGLALASG